MKENQARITDIAKLEGKLDTENNARKSEIANLDSWAKGENDARKTEIANLDNFAHSENDARKKEIRDREDACNQLQARMDEQNAERTNDMDELKTRLMKENAFLKSMASKPMSVYFDAYRTKAYDGGGEENLTFQGCSANNGGGMDHETGIFTCPLGGTYMFVFHVATHDNKKALLSIRLNGGEVASVFDQNHKDNHKTQWLEQPFFLISSVVMK